MDPHTEEELRHLDEVGTRLVRQEGHIFISEGEETDHVLLIKKGHVKVTAGKPARIIAFRGPGQVVGETAPVLRMPRSANVIAYDEEVEVLHIAAHDYEAFLRKFDDAHWRLTKDTVRRYYEATKKLVASDFAIERQLAQALVWLVDVGIAKDVDGALTVRMAQSDLASLIGAKSLPSVKKIIKSFKESEIIDTGRLVVHLQNLALLKEISEGRRTASR